MRPDYADGWFVTHYLSSETYDLNALWLSDPIGASLSEQVDKRTNTSIKAYSPAELNGLQYNVIDTLFNVH